MKPINEAPVNFQVGDLIHTWFAQADGSNVGKILQVLPYTGKYPQWFTHVLRLTSPNRVGWTEMAAGKYTETYPPKPGFVRVEVRRDNGKVFVIELESGERKGYSMPHGCAWESGIRYLSEQHPLFV